MNDSVEILEIENDAAKKKDWFMILIIILLAILVISFTLVYFFGYDLLKPYIKV